MWDLTGPRLLLNTTPFHQYFTSKAVHFTDTACTLGEFYLENWWDIHSFYLKLDRFQVILGGIPLKIRSKSGEMSVKCWCNDRQNGLCFWWSSFAKIPSIPIGILGILAGEARCGI